MSYQQPPPPSQWQGQPQQPNTGYQQPSGPQWPPQQPGMYPQQQPIQPGGYPPPYQQPPMMPPGPPQRPPVKKLSRRTWIIIGVIVLVLFIISAVSNAGKGTATPTSVAPTATPIIVNSQATATPVLATATAIPTANPTQATSSAIIPTHGIPFLGGPISDFYGKYGTPNNHSSGSSYGSTYHWFRDGSSNVDGLIVWNLTHYPQVDSIGVQAINGDMPDTNAAIALCTVYNPSDAHQLKNIPLVDALGKASGFDVIYVSNTLAQTFAAADFTDANGNTVQRGSFDIQYLYKGDGTQSIDSCSILPGEQQTTG